MDVFPPEVPTTYPESYVWSKIQTCGFNITFTEDVFTSLPVSFSGVVILMAHQEVEAHGGIASLHDLLKGLLHEQVVLMP